MPFNFVSRSAATIGIALSILACSDANGPADKLTREELSGSYVAKVPATGGAAFGTLVLSTTQNGVTVDHVAQGAEIRLALASNGATSGSLHVPNVELGDSKEPVTFDANLAGTWSLDGNTITLSHDADTFLRDMPLTVKGDRLEGDRTFGGVRVRLSLVRQ
ncbi:MAG TPA: hypothetical protein VM076_26250 [Gemmatimonadaceae bacterium]|nr:hypothetical protein [Gemmatimonadaceae bacterium]